MSDEGRERPRIIIDEDWKSQVEAERERLAEAGGGTKSEPAASRPGQAGPGQAGPGQAGPEQAGQEEGELPPASLLSLVSMLATQSMACLGQLPDPETNQRFVHLPLARHYIDLLEMLAAKTQGNRSTDESQVLEQMLHELRMAFVSVQSQVEARPSPSAERPPGGAGS